VLETSKPLLYNNLLNKGNVMKFKDKTFYYCYDCGYGERGVSERGISYDEAFYLLKGDAAKWAAREDGFFKVGVNHYMVASDEYIEEDWEGDYYGV
jgi:hypothetical protein